MSEKITDLGKMVKEEVRKYMDDIKDTLMIQLVGFIQNDKNNWEHKYGSQNENVPHFTESVLDASENSVIVEVGDTEEAAENITLQEVNDISSADIEMSNIVIPKEEDPLCGSFIDIEANLLTSKS